jgi:DNA polymerase-3 subunit epsilon
MTDEPRSPARRLVGGPWRRASFASLDFEATGLDPDRDDIVSFGVVPVVGGRIVYGERVYQEVSPAAALTARTVVVHGLRPADVADAPPLDAARGVLAAALDRRVVLAWAAEVEAGFLASTFGGSPRRWRRRIVDVLGLARLVDRLDGRDPGPGGYSLTAAAERYGVPMERPHHALDDALTAAQLFLVHANRLGGTPRGLVRAGRRGRR